MKSFPHLTYARAVVLFFSALLCGVPGLLKADEPVEASVRRLDDDANQAGRSKVASEIGNRFTNFAGSPANASALVTGLHDGTAITLTTTVNNQAATIEFQPTSRQLGYGNIFIALALAQGSLAKAGIVQPTADQIVAALNGGAITGNDGGAIALTGVLTQRAAGNGWADIAQSLGVNLGPVVQNLQAAHQHIVTGSTQ
ncbi:MAG TPA: hypothetical protein VIM71_01815 [Lacunisphaera sp.]